MADTETSAGRRELSGQQAALVIGGLLLVLVAVWFLLLRGGGEEPAVDAQNAPVTTDTATPAPEETDEAPAPSKGRVETFEVFAPRDPFEPVIDLTSGGDSGSGSGGSGTAGDGSGSGSGDTGSGDTGSGSGDTGSGNGGSTIQGDNGGRNVGGHRVKLIDAFTEKGKQRAQVQVDDTVYTVDEGETFAGNFKLLSVSGECASMLFGDDQFTICEGEEILK